MTLAGFVLLLISAFSWSGFDITRKNLTSSLKPWHLAFFLHLGQAVFFMLWAVFDRLFFDTSYIPYGLVMIIISTFASACFLGSVMLGDLSKTVPLLAFSPVFSVANAAWLLDELPSRVQIMGVCLVVFGAIALHCDVLSRFRKQTRQEASPFLPSALMLFTGYLWSLVTVLDKKVMLIVSPSLHGLFENTGAALAIGLVFLFLGKSRELRVPRSQWRVYLLACLLASFAFGFQLLAVVQMPAAVFDAGKRCFGTLASLSMGALIFKEKVSYQHWVAAFLLCAGILTLALF